MFLRKLSPLHLLDSFDLKRRSKRSSETKFRLKTFFSSFNPTWAQCLLEETGELTRDNKKLLLFFQHNVGAVSTVRHRGTGKRQQKIVAVLSTQRGRSVYCETRDNKKLLEQCLRDNKKLLLFFQHNVGAVSTVRHRGELAETTKIVAVLSTQRGRSVYCETPGNWQETTKIVAVLSTQRGRSVYCETPGNWQETTKIVAVLSTQRGRSVYCETPGNWQETTKIVAVLSTQRGRSVYCETPGNWQETTKIVAVLSTQRGRSVYCERHNWELARDNKNCCCSFNTTWAQCLLHRGTGKRQQKIVAVLSTQRGRSVYCETPGNWQETTKNCCCSFNTTWAQCLLHLGTGKRQQKLLLFFQHNVGAVSTVRHLGTGKRQQKIVAVLSTQRGRSVYCETPGNWQETTKNCCCSFNTTWAQCLLFFQHNVGETLGNWQETTKIVAVLSTQRGRSVYCETPGELRQLETTKIVAVLSTQRGRSVYCETPGNWQETTKNCCCSFQHNVGAVSTVRHLGTGKRQQKLLLFFQHNVGAVSTVRHLGTGKRQQKIVVVLCQLVYCETPGHWQETTKKLLLFFQHNVGAVSTVWQETPFNTTWGTGQETTKIVAVLSTQRGRSVYCETPGNWQETTKNCCCSFNTTWAQCLARDNKKLFFETPGNWQETTKIVAVLFNTTWAQCLLHRGTGKRQQKIVAVLSTQRGRSVYCDNKKTPGELARDNKKLLLFFQHNVGAVSTVRHRGTGKRQQKIVAVLSTQRGRSVYCETPGNWQETTKNCCCSFNTTTTKIGRSETRGLLGETPGHWQETTKNCCCSFNTT
ncbi:unnamed protein product [Acanthosepion pharaonis]|uniref:Uncharacterized protein n=1 Tax=Acanthosepion pharaonis TaxID=158019 RepID=A0A812DM24_ACAPH|nr:unnamed protein product [Sepia pharaonis]